MKLLLAITRMPADQFPTHHEEGVIIVIIAFLGLSPLIAFMIWLICQAIKGSFTKKKKK